MAPVDVSAEAGRVWLVWPKSIINLNVTGNSDMQTLLTLFATQDARWGDGDWTAGNGVICSDGYWRGFIDPHSALAQIDLFSGLVSSREWKGKIPDSIYPATEGQMIIFSGDRAFLSGFGSENLELESSIPPVSMLAVSTHSPLAAWRDGINGSLHISSYKNSTETEINFPPGIPRGISWVGDMLVIAYQGKLYAIDVKNTPGGEYPAAYRMEDKRLPESWYRIRGGENYLVIQSPEEETAMVLSIENADDEGLQLNENFSQLLEAYALSAGDELERAGLPRRAERYYRWVIHYVREFRSRYPLEGIWPDLESEITRRRVSLR